MNYTGRPSISGCRPVLSLYPTHRFCQYLLLIFITFTNSSLFTRAFSTNSRRPLSHAAGVTTLPEGEELNLSVIASQCHCPGCGSQRLLRCRSHPAGRGPNSSSLFPPLAAVVAVAPTEGRLWQSPQSERFRQRLPYQGSCLRSRLRGCTKESLSSVGKSGSWHLLYLFGETCGIMGLRPCPPIYSGGEVRKMESILSFILSVGANVAAYYICKWLDGWFMGRKH